MKIGIVDLDTSHPAAWIPIEREMGHEIAGIFDGGSVRSREYVKDFTVEHGIPKLYESLPQMAAEVDCAIIHGCDWDTHIEKARPFVEAGKSILIDKPFAGNDADLRQIRDWVAQGARIAGGSALRFCSELRAWLARPLSERGTPHTAFAGCAVDDFNYGIHAYSLLIEAMGGGIHSVRHLGKGVQRRIQIEWNDGRTGFLAIGKQEKWLPFHISVVTEQTVAHFEPDPLELYRAILEATIPYLAKESDLPPISLDTLVEPELAALAARQSWLDGDRKVLLSDLDKDQRYDGAAFAVTYREAQRISRLRP